MTSSVYFTQCKLREISKDERKLTLTLIISKIDELRINITDYSYDEEFVIKQIINLEILETKLKNFDILDDNSLGELQFTIANMD